MTTPFPFLRLPRLALIPVLQHMEIIEVIAFSLISKRTHKLSKYLRKTICSRYIDLRIENYYLCMRIPLTNRPLLLLYFNACTSKTVEVFYPYQTTQWKNVELSTGQWIERLLDVTKCPSLRKVILNGTPGCDVFSVFNVVPIVSNLTLSQLPFSNREEFQRFWMGNVRRLSIHNDDLSRFQFSLNDLLASNAIKLELCEVSMSLRDLNRFFSCWLNKTSNRRLKHLSVQSHGHFDEDVLLKGLGGTRFDERRASEFPTSDTFPHFTTFTGGFDVRRIDGKLAAITFRENVTKKFINFNAGL
ncbi:hypothetical protein CRE_10527 [Caenorhabditis remanei]|uniref:F-box domain-containing protein n=1 Tax=Caenorhabditis remanei TaxID=31234 RepID=E3N0R0_CAERE|nr:hypothetical protein CRE_10527 [Caenorhabditis remanei]